MFPARKVLAMAFAAFFLTGAGKAHREEHVPAQAHAEPERQAEAARPAASGHGAHWTYEGSSGPDHWGDMSDDYALCKTGHMQSPVDLGAADIQGKLAISARYRSGQLTILNNGHTIQASIPEGSTLSSGVNRYKLLQIHFHTPSEETVYGIHYPMVAHFVHTDYAGNLAVLGILFEEGAPNAELQKLIKAAPAVERGPETVNGVTFDPSKLLPTSMAVWRYEGSLTTPPCSEGVRWHVAMEPVSASAAQIAAIHAIIGDNARPIQPRHGRLLAAGTD